MRMHDVGATEKAFVAGRVCWWRLGLVVNGVRLYAVAERNLDSIAVIINLVAIPVGVGIVVGGGTWLTASALIWRREAKREEERKRLEAEKQRRNKTC